MCVYQWFLSRQISVDSECLGEASFSLISMSYQMFLSTISTIMLTNTKDLSCLQFYSCIHRGIGFCAPGWFCFLLQVYTSPAAPVLYGNPACICKLTLQRKKEGMVSLSYVKASHMANTHTKELNTFLLEWSNCIWVEKRIGASDSVYHTATVYAIWV